MRPSKPVEVRARRFMTDGKVSEARELLGKFLPEKGVREGQSKQFVDKNLYVKAGNLHKYDLDKDAKIKSQHIRKAGDATWRGDEKGKMV